MHPLYLLLIGLPLLGATIWGLGLRMGFYEGSVDEDKSNEED